jgi:hypothetical protein
MSTPYTTDVVYKKYTVYVTTCPLCEKAIYELDELELKERLIRHLNESHPTYGVKTSWEK